MDFSDGSVTVVRPGAAMDVTQALLAFRDANKSSSLVDDWKGPSEQWRGLKKEEGELTELMLDGCGLSQVPPEVAGLHKLQKLWLSNNGLRQLPDEIGQPAGLHSLWLGNNLLRSLPEGISRLGNLKQL
eukprot:GHRQ01011439.1.p2 GENE.GHRQ01011439.1~~GHRQ01011439.1.p2  ORF type:complete len:129 (+),score=35.61 GHRQ01011439.1:280-666(+)